MVAPWSRSASGTPPWASSSPLAKGSGITAAPTASELSSSGISWNGMLAKCTLCGEIPCSASTDAVSRNRTLSGALIATVCPLRSASDLTGESGSV